MAENSATCAKCGGRMQEGFVADYGHGTIIPSRWVKGRPRRSFLTGTKTRDQPNFQMAALRCERCGFVEFYARERVG